jgi:hypothetical protein
LSDQVAQSGQQGCRKIVGQTLIRKVCLSSQLKLLSSGDRESEISAIWTLPASWRGFIDRSDQLPRAAKLPAAALSHV